MTWLPNEPRPEHCDPQPVVPHCDHAERLERIEAAVSALLDWLEEILPTLMYVDQAAVVLREIAKTRAVMRGGE